MKTITFQKKRGTKKIIDFDRKLSDYYDDDVFLNNEDFDGNELPADQWTLTNGAGNTILEGREAIESETGVLDFDGEYDTIYVESADNLSDAEIEILREHYLGGGFYLNYLEDDILEILGYQKITNKNFGKEEATATLACGKQLTFSYADYEDMAEEEITDDLEWEFGKEEVSPFMVKEFIEDFIYEINY